MAAMRVRAAPTAQPVRSTKQAQIERIGTTLNVLGHHAIVQATIDAELAKPLEPEIRTLNMLRYWMSFARIKARSLTTPEAYEWVCEAINLGMILCEQDLGAEHKDTFIAAQEALYRAWTRAQRSGRYHLDAPGIGEIVRAMQVHDVQLEVALRSELARAERTLLQRLNEGNTYTVEPVEPLAA